MKLRLTRKRITTYDFHNPDAEPTSWEMATVSFPTMSVGVDAGMSDNQVAKSAVDALFSEISLARVKGKAEDKGDGLVDDGLRFFAVGVKIRMSR